MTQPPAFDGRALLGQSGPLSRADAEAALGHAAQLMGTADFLDAARIYQRVIGFDDHGITTAAMVGLGEALHRLDDDESALGEWEAATKLPDNAYTYAAWRNVAAARVRAGNLNGALAAYREADRRAPREDKAEIANRMGWLSKEVGDRGASGKYFARARGDEGIPIALVLVALTVVVSLAANFIPPEVIDLYGILALVKPLLAEGELWRLWTVTLVHAPLQQMPLHLVFNAYLLYLAGPFVERMYGRSTFLAFYLLAAAGGSLASFAFSSGPVSVGASGAIFGLFGVMVAVQYVHRPILDQGSRAFLGQAVGLVVLNLILGLVLPSVDNWAHIGGLVAGLLVGVLFAPTRVQSMRSLWMRPGSTPGTAVPVFGTGGSVAIKAMGLVLLALAFLAMWSVGVATWS